MDSFTYSMTRKQKEREEKEERMFYLFCMSLLSNLRIYMPYLVEMQISQGQEEQ